MIVCTACHRSRIGMLVACALAALTASAVTVLAANISDLDPSKTYRTAAVTLSGSQAFSEQDLLGVMKTRARPLYLAWQVWRPPPAFVPATFEHDVSNIERFYRANGYYDAKVHHRLSVRDSQVTAHIQIQEGKPVEVAAITIDVEDRAPRPDALEPSFKLPLQRGDVFKEGEYQTGETDILAVYMRNGYAHAEVRRRAQVLVRPHRAYIWYLVNPGPRGVFGLTTVQGLRAVDRWLVLRELTYKPGETFDSRKLAASRARILALNLFGSVEFQPEQAPANPGVVPIRIEINEKPAHSLNFMLGYNTESQFNIGIGWNDYNFAGGGRQLTLNASYSNIISSLDTKLIQPDFFSPNLTLVLDASQAQEVYQTYTLNVSRFDPLLTYTFTPRLSGSLGWRIEYLKFNSLDSRTIAAIGGVRRQGILSGPTAYLIYKSTDDPLDPHNGAVFTLSAETSDTIFGGDYRYWRTVGEIKHYNPLPFGLVFAKRFELGVENTFATVRDIPLSERFYSGGEGSVRGYALRRIGPVSPANEPLGGLTLVEGSLELRHHLFWILEGAAFFDCGQVSEKAYRVPVDALQCGYGPAVSAATPVGPVRLDLGFPTRASRGDNHWQIYFSIGQYY